MPDGSPRPLVTGARYCARGAATALIWTLWLALSLLFALQVYIASVRELQVPRFVLRAIEDRLAESGVSVKFGRAIFDPSGRILIEKARFTLASFAEPVVTADAIYIRVDPWALFQSRFDAREIRATGANLFIPAMLSASGKAEKIVEDLDGGFSITSRGDEFSVDYLSCRLGGICLSAHGTVNAGTVERRDRTEPSLPLTEFVSKNYVALSREFSRVEEQMDGLDQPIVTAIMTPSDTRGAIVSARVGAAGFKMATPFVLEADGIRGETRFPLLGGTPLMTSAFVSAENLDVAGNVAASGVRVGVRGILNVDTLSFNPRLVEATAGSVTSRGAVLVAPFARVVPGTGKAFSAEASAWLYDSPVQLKGIVDLADRSADATFDGSLSPTLLAPLSARLGTDVRRFADLTEPFEVRGSAKLDPGWKLARVAAHVDGRSFTAYHVWFDEARADVDFDGRYLGAHHAVIRRGDDHTEGSYVMDFKTKAYRYLLTGSIRPLVISPWFGDWWPNLFRNFGFPTRPPDATIDIRGRYLPVRNFSVFGYADAKNPVLMGVPFDTAHVRLYTDQWVCEGFEFNVTQGEGVGQGSFKLTTEPASGKWSTLDVELKSTVDPIPLATLLPADGAASIAAFNFTFARPPALYVTGHFDGPASPGNGNKKIHAETIAGGPLTIHGVAFDKASFKVDISNDTIDVSDIDAGFAGGTVAGSASMSGEAASRRLRFKASLAGASLGQAARAAEGYVVAPSAGSPKALETFARDKSGVRLDLNVSAEGQPGELASFGGDGNMQVQGNIGELPLLGGLSRFLKFPELRFTQARSQFGIQDGSLLFGDISVLGANSAIKAKGTYAIEPRQLDFTATIYPFQESRSLLQIFNALSTPISAVFRVKLSGTIEKPTWALAYSPLNLLRQGDLKANPAEKLAPSSPLANPSP